MELQSFSSILSTHPILNPPKIKVYEISLVWITVTFSVRIEANSCGFAQDGFCSILSCQNHRSAYANSHCWTQVVVTGTRDKLPSCSNPSQLVGVPSWTWVDAFSSLPRNRHRTEKGVGTSCLKHSHSLWKVRDQNNKIKQQVRSVVRWCLFPWLVIVSTERRPCACLRFLIPKRMDLKNGSAGIGARCQAWQPKFHSKTYVMEGQKWLSQVVLWSLWACCGI